MKLGEGILIGAIVIGAGMLTYMIYNYVQKTSAGSSGYLPTKNNSGGGNPGAPGAGGGTVPAGWTSGQTIATGGDKGQVGTINSDGTIKLPGGQSVAFPEIQGKDFNNRTITPGDTTAMTVLGLYVRVWSGYYGDSLGYSQTDQGNAMNSLQIYGSEGGVTPLPSGTNGQGAGTNGSGGGGGGGIDIGSILSDAMKFAPLLA